MLSIIAAASENNVIGNKGQIPWRLRNDMFRFKEITTGHPVIMGRKTAMSFAKPGEDPKPLPNRRNIVVTRQPDFKLEGFEVANSLEEALVISLDNDPGRETFIIGGGELYKEALRYARQIYLTRVHAEVEGDAFFPELHSEEWEEIKKEKGVVDEKNQFPHTFLVYERK